MQFVAKIKFIYSNTSFNFDLEPEKVTSSFM